MTPYANPNLDTRMSSLARRAKLSDDVYTAYVAERNSVCQTGSFWLSPLFVDTFLLVFRTDPSHRMFAYLHFWYSWARVHPMNRLKNSSGKKLKVTKNSSWSFLFKREYLEISVTACFQGNLFEICDVMYVELVTLFAELNPSGPRSAVIKIWANA